MINNFFKQQIKEYFPYLPTDEQEKALSMLVDFLLSSPDQAQETVFILRGYAGTGKTSLIGALVKAMTALQQKTLLLAPTGRAAKVFAGYAGQPAYTIHKKIYRQKAFGQESEFGINVNLLNHTLFIVDEASMIANDGLSGSFFGTGRLLDDLVQFVYSGTGCRLLLLGDTAQLPPVGELESPALVADQWKGYGLQVMETDLKEVVRQELTSGILWNATRMRQLIANEQCGHWPKIRLSGLADVILLSGNDLIDTLSTCYDQDGMDETIVICRSNKQANIYNQGIRGRVLFRDEELNAGEHLMIVKNNYFWTQNNEQMEFIANGDVGIVRRVRRGSDMYGFRFQQVLLSFPDYNDTELEVRILMDTLHSESPALTRAENERLFDAVQADYADITNKRDRMQKIKNDPYHNALQVKYAYAVTCHKAQGGQWKNVFLDQGYMTADMLGAEYYRWLYTAFTRATDKLYLINFPKEQIE